MLNVQSQPSASTAEPSDPGAATADQGGADIPAGLATAATLAVGATVLGAVDQAFDADWYRIGLTAGQSYLFTEFGDGEISLIDPYLKLYDAAGRLLTFNDDGAMGRNAGLRFTPTATGTYFISAEGWEDEAGGYRLTMAEVAAQDPLATLDWGTQLADPAVRVYLALPGETVRSSVANQAWSAQLTARVLEACAGWAAVCGVTFTRVDQMADATLVLMLSDLGGDIVGRANTPPASPAVAAFDPRWLGSVTPGHTGYTTLVHEIGHVLGLAHPHDDGGASQAMEGVTDEFDSYGVAELNQGVFTAMGYNDGWALQLDAFAGVASWGNQAGPMALDIAVVQRKYGAVANRPGDDLYHLDGNGPFLAIWDTGGVDTISLRGVAQGVIVDLRPATLLNAPGGGGYPSYPKGGLGGFTIAAGVEIENAQGGSFNDVLTGNGLANQLRGDDGDDRLTGAGGNDVLQAGFGVDTAVLLGLASDYQLTRGPLIGWLAQDLRAGAPDGLDELYDVELIEFADYTHFLAPPSDALRVRVGFDNILRGEASGAALAFRSSLIASLSSGETTGGAIAKIVQRADDTTSVATLSYQFFTGLTPSGAGLDYLLDPAGPNANTLNSAYYQAFNIENRYINFAVNLGKLGEGAVAFLADYGAKTLFQATRDAYMEIFGGTVTDAKVSSILDTPVGAMTRAQYFAYYGGDDIGTKAAMAGWLLTEAAKANVGLYARANEALLTDLADGAALHIDLIGVYGRPDYVFNG